MVWSVFAMILSGLALRALHLWRRSRHLWIAIVAFALAVVTFLTGLSIGVFVAPLAIVTLVVAAVMVPSTRRVA